MVFIVDDWNQYIFTWNMVYICNSKCQTINMQPMTSLRLNFMACDFDNKERAMKHWRTWIDGQETLDEATSVPFYANLPQLFFNCQKLANFIDLFFLQKKY